MTMGELAGLIAAIAFAALVIFICIVLSKIPKLIKDINETVQHLNTTIDVVTKDVDNLSIEVEGLLNKANTLVDDVNGKLAKTDPLFVAIGDVGHSVSDLNDSTKEMASNLVSGVSKRKKSPLSKLGKFTQFKSKETPKQEDIYEVVNPHSVVDKTELSEDVLKESEFYNIDIKKPSTTAGEITIK